MKWLLVLIAVGWVDGEENNMEMMDQDSSILGFRTSCPLPASQSLQDIGVAFYMSNSTHNGSAISASPSECPVTNASRIIFIVHGFTADSGNQWIQDLTRNLVKRGSIVVAVDWKEGAKGPNYLEATANIPVVAEEMSRLIGYLIEHCANAPDIIHLMGHSLGAHLCGHAGKLVQNNTGVLIDKITGMDPAGPCFKPSDPGFRLSPDNARRVLAIQTNSFFFGIDRCDGHLCLLINGGCFQPGCPITPSFQDFKKETACSHNKATSVVVAMYEGEDCGIKGIPTSGYSKVACSGDLIKVLENEMLQRNEPTALTWNSSGIYEVETVKDDSICQIENGEQTKNETSFIYQSN